MTDVFISYSRSDSSFVHRLHTALADDKRDIWVDWKNIPLTANWWQEICAGIDATNTFVFVVSPTSIASPVCNMEVAYAIENNKRLVPVIFNEANETAAFETLAHTKLDDLSQSILGTRDIVTVARRNWVAIARHNWLYFQDESRFSDNYHRLLDAINTDLDYVRIHTSLLVRAREWHDKAHHFSFLLSGISLQEASVWLSASENKSPKPTQLQITFIISSQNSRTRQNRVLFIVVTITLAVMFVLSVISFMLYQEALESLAFSNATEHVLETDIANVMATNDAYATTNTSD